MKLLPLLAGLSLAALALVATPAASADHCAEQPLGGELKCEAGHAIDEALDPVNRLYNSPPADWRSCLR